MSLYVNNKDPRKSPDFAARPTFCLWDAIFFLEDPGTTLSKADEVIFGHWDDYADQAINLLHQMIKQTDRLVFSNDEYTGLVRTFQAFPRRPNLTNVLRDNLYDEHESAVQAVTKLEQTPAQRLWHMWASRVEEIHQALAELMIRSELKRADQDKEDLGLGDLSIVPGLAKTDTWTGLLHKILDSASEPDEGPEGAQTGLEGHMQLMGF